MALGVVGIHLKPIFYKPLGKNSLLSDILDLPWKVWLHVLTQARRSFTDVGRIERNWYLPQCVSVDP